MKKKELNPEQQQVVESEALQFKFVFVVGLEEGLLPIGLRQGDAELSDTQHIEEERRLFYVGMTRAEDILYLSQVQNRRIAGEAILQKPSILLQEIPSDRMIPVENQEKKRKVGRKIQQLSLFE